MEALSQLEASPDLHRVGAPLEAVYGRLLPPAGNTKHSRFYSPLVRLSAHGESVLQHVPVVPFNLVRYVCAP